MWKYTLAVTLLLGAGSFLPLAQPQWRASAQNERIIDQSVKKYALVIGNANYTQQPLKNPVNDARLMASTLSQLGFAVSKHENIPDTDSFFKALREFRQRLEPGSVALFYYAGHGMQVNGQNFLLPTQVEIQEEAQVKYKALNLEDILSQLEQSKTRMNLVILDACRDNPYERKFRSGSSRGLAIVTPPRGTLIAYATDANSVASDGDGSNGLYTEALVKSLRKPGLLLSNVFRETRREVLQRSNNRQNPAEYDKLLEDFYFVPPQPTPVPAALASPTPTPVPTAAPTQRPTPIPAPTPASITYTVADPVCVSCPRRANANEEVVIKVRLKYEGPEQVRAVVDWGDGTQQKVGGWFTGEGVSSLSHRYSKGGNYTIQVRNWTPSGLNSSQILRQPIEIIAPRPTPTPVPLQTARPQPVKTQPTPAKFERLRNSLGMEFVRIPAGTFTMGSPAGERRPHANQLHERQRQVTLSQAFYMQTTEVTQAQWQAVMGTTLRQQYEDTREKQKETSLSLAGEGTNYPMYFVSWHDVQAYIRKLNVRGEGEYRLPTEAEWEYAARAGSRGRYALGDTEDALKRTGWYRGNSDGQTHPVAQKEPNVWGLYDMHGNVSEWVQDWYDGTYYGVTETITDPKGPPGNGDFSSERAWRGGSWRHDAQDVRSAMHFGASPNWKSRNNDLGFRLVRIR